MIDKKSSTKKGLNYMEYFSKPAHLLSALILSTFKQKINNMCLIKPLLRRARAAAVALALHSLQVF